MWHVDDVEIVMVLQVAASMSVSLRVRIHKKREKNDKILPEFCGTGDVAIIDSCFTDCR